MKEKERSPAILTINGGSSSVKFAVFLVRDIVELYFKGQVKQINSSQPSLQWKRSDSDESQEISLEKKNSIAEAIIQLVDDQLEDQLIAVTHRIVHGMQHTRPQLITPELIDELSKICSIDTEHLPAEIELIQQFQKHYPHLKHVACFDTAFHSTMPLVARWIPIPRKYFDKGIQRYGFHGLSYSFLVEELQRLVGNEALGKIVLAHLGSGASLAAVKDGVSMDTSMGFTPTLGIPMSTRSGDLLV